MCLYTKYIKNPAYKPNKKNGFTGVIGDPRMQYVPIACGKCIECRKAKAREWQVRLSEEIKMHKDNVFVTLTFNEDELKKLKNEISDKNENKIAIIAVRRFLERWRKKYKKSVKHWLITELGHNGTERIHLHGIIMLDDVTQREDIDKIWGYGYTFLGQFCNQQTINYIIKYVTKIDIDHKDYEPKILCSAGIGKNYADLRSSKMFHKYRPNQTQEYYRLENGAKIQLPIYYRNKFYNDEERQKLWLEKIKKKTRYVRGIKCTLKNEDERRDYMMTLKKAQEENIYLGYGDDTWNKKSFKTMIDVLNDDKNTW